MAEVKGIRGSRDKKKVQKIREFPILPCLNLKKNANIMLHAEMGMKHHSYPCIILDIVTEGILGYILYFIKGK